MGIAIQTTESCKEENKMLKVYFGLFILEISKLKKRCSFPLEITKILDKWYSPFSTGERVKNEKGQKTVISDGIGKV